MNANLYHGVVGTKFVAPLNIPMEAKVGYRRVTDQTEIAHGLIKGKIKSGQCAYLEIGYRRLFTRSNLNFLPTEEDRNAYDMTYTFSERINANLGFEYVPTNTDATGKYFVNVGEPTRKALSRQRPSLA